MSCDVPSHYYSFSFELKSDWSHRFSRGHEILDYLEMVADKYDVKRSIRFGRELIESRWEDDHWNLSFSDGHTTEADILVSATGVLHHPRYPDIDGLDSFSGNCFHSARWNHEVQLDGRRIGVIGNGSTSIQMVTELVSRVKNITIFQRTAQWIAPAGDKPYSDAFKKLMRYVPGLGAFVYYALRVIFEQIGGRAVIRPGWQRRQVAETCRANLSNVSDPGLRAKLTPDYEPMCKRLVMSAGFYDAVQSENCSVVTETIERVEPGGVRTSDGSLHELDVLVLATGFDSQAFMRPINLVGENGLTLEEAWSEAVTAYRWVALPGFPNFFMLQGPNGPVGNFSLISIAETQCDYILKCIRLLQNGRLKKISPRPEVCARLEEKRIKALDNSIWSTGCNSWYIDKRGIPALWPYTPEQFRRDLKTPRVAELNAS